MVRLGVLRRGLWVLWQAVREQPGLFVVGVIGGILFGLTTVAGAYVVGAVLGRVALPAFSGGRYTVGALAVAAGAILSVSLVKIAGIYGRRLGAGSMQFRLQASFRRRVTRRYLDLPLAWHHRHATGTLLSNANSDVEATWFPIAPLPFAVGTLVMLVGAVASLFVTDWVLALVGVAVFPTLFTLNVAYSRRMSPRMTRAQQLRAEVSAIAHESFDGALVVKTLGREAEETERMAVKTAELRDALVAVGRIRGAFDPLMDALPNLGTLAVLVVGGARLASGAITVSELVGTAFLFTVLAFPVRAIGWVLGELPRSVVGWDRVQRVLTATGDMTYGERRLDRDAGPGTLEFDRVSFAYPAPVSGDVTGAALDNEPQHTGPDVLHELTFRVSPGSTVALVGPTGSGKSTITALATRLMDPNAGVVRVDGVPATELAADSLAATMALVPQVPFVFDDTVHGNVSLGRPGIDEAEVWRALELAQADGFVRHLPDKLDAMVGERGTTLSGGQRQRLTLARALAGRPRVLLLDDATSAVDPRVEAAILAGLRSAELATTVLVVAYRRATIALADQVVYVEHGRVIAVGTHRELLATVPGYANLVTAYERDEAERARERGYDEPVELELPG